MVMRRQLALLYTLAAEEIQDLSILCVHKYRSANLSALLQNTEESTVIYMKRLSSFAPPLCGIVRTARLFGRHYPTDC